MYYMLNKIKLAFYMQYITMSLSRAGAVIPLRSTDPRFPCTWEFSGFSQNGEDGIIDYLTGKILKQNRYFLEIGSGSGLENNTSWLAIAKKYSGLMVEGNRRLSGLSRLIMSRLNIGVDCRYMFATLSGLQHIADSLIYSQPDVFSLDIDGNDYYIAKGLLEHGVKPKIIVVEFNSAYGPQKSITIRYQENFNIYKAHNSFLYYGASITAWKKLFMQYNYKFVTVDLNGTNAFFVDTACFEQSFINGLNGANFSENFFQFKKFKSGWEEQYKLIKNMDYLEV